MVASIGERPGYQYWGAMDNPRWGRPHPCRCTFTKIPPRCMVYGVLYIALSVATHMHTHIYIYIYTHIYIYIIIIYIYIYIYVVHIYIYIYIYYVFVLLLFMQFCYGGWSWLSGQGLMNGPMNNAQPVTMNMTIPDLLPQTGNAI